MNGLQFSATCLLAIGLSGNANAQVAAPTDQQLYLSGQIGLANGNCVKASRFYFAYLLRNPVELQTDYVLRTRLEKVIATCDSLPSHYAFTSAIFSRTPPTKQALCEKYSEISVAQNDAASLARCGFTGSRWNAAVTYHHTWCMGAADSQRNAELEARKTALNACAPSQ